MAERKGRVVKAKSTKPVSNKSTEDELFDAYARVCFYYPQYKFQEARRLPHKRVNHLLKTAQQEKAAEYLMGLEIAAAPHTKNGAGVKSLRSTLKGIING